MVDLPAVRWQIFRLEKWNVFINRFSFFEEKLYVSVKWGDLAGAPLRSVGRTAS